MLPLSNIVLHLRETCTIFGRRVAGTSHFSADTQKDTTDISLPFAYVIPMFGQDEGQLTPIKDVAPQWIVEHFAVVVCIDNRLNRAGAAGVSELDPLDQLHVIQEALKKSLMGWRYTPQADPTRYTRDNHVGMSNTRLWHQWEFRVKYLNNPQENDAINAQVSAIVNSLSNYGNDETPSGQINTVHLLRKDTSPAPLDLVSDWVLGDPPLATTPPTQDQINAALAESVTIDLTQTPATGPGVAVDASQSGVLVDENGNVVVDENGNPLSTDSDRFHGILGSEES